MAKSSSSSPYETPAAAMPTTLPERSKIGDPLLPGESAALIWRIRDRGTARIGRRTPNSSSSSNSSGANRSGEGVGSRQALTIPSVTVRAKPRGLPMTAMGSPDFKLEESPSSTTGRPTPST